MYLILYSRGDEVDERVMFNTFETKVKLVYNMYNILLSGFKENSIQ